MGLGFEVFRIGGGATPLRVAGSGPPLRHSWILFIIEVHTSVSCYSYYQLLLGGGSAQDRSFQNAGFFLDTPSSA